VKTKNNKSVKDRGKGRQKAEKKESSNHKGMSGKIVCFCGVAGHTKPSCKFKSLYVQIVPK